LCTGNARHLRALLAAATKLSAFLQQPQGLLPGSNIGTAPAAAAAAGRAMTVNDFLFAAGLDHVNMFSLVRCPSMCLHHLCTALLRRHCSQHMRDRKKLHKLKLVQQELSLIVNRRCRYVKESKVLFKVAGFADVQRRREVAAAGGAPTWICELLDSVIPITRSPVHGGVKMLRCRYR
jgi:hypothetical protein